MRPRTIAVVLIAFVPLAVRSVGARTSATQAILFVVAAMGLNLAAGYAGQPSLAQGAFAGIGAYAVATLRVHAGWGPLPSTLAAIGFSIVAGAVVARGVARLRPAFVALSTWLVAWTFAIAIAAFPHTSGGAAGLVLGDARIHMPLFGISFRLGGFAWYEIALVLAVVVWVGSEVCMRRYGPALHALRADPVAASAAGVPVESLRFGMLVASAAIAGAAGALLVQVAGVADATSYAPLRSLELFVVVLLGGTATLEGPLAGALALFALSRIGAAIASLTGARAQIEAIGAGVVLFALVAAGTHGIVPLFRRIVGARSAVGERAESAPLAPNGGAALVVAHATVDFGAVRALDDASVEVRAGRVHALIGPNGSGKTTLLRVIAGALQGAQVTLDGSDLSSLDAGERVRKGIVRTFQRLAIAPDVTALEHVVSGMEARRTIGALRAVTNTPGARAEHRAIAVEANAILAAVGLGARANMRADELTVGERRSVQIARALAARPRVLLLDEPSAGLDLNEERHLLALLARARDEGLTIVLVEHNIALVRAIANRVTVLDAGRVIAEGAPDDVANDPSVRAAYLGAG